MLAPTPPAPDRAWWAPWALLPDGPARDVLLEVRTGRFTAVRAGFDAGRAQEAGAEALPGVVLPGLANAHSHAFHRALRGRTHDGGGTFWTWRERMYDVAARLDPDSYLALARATYGEMALAGYTAVGEFHYLHHQPGGTPYADPNAMGLALIEAAAQAGIRLTLLDTAYLAGGLGPRGHLPLGPQQLRFADRAASGEVSAAAWAERAGGLISRERESGEDDRGEPARWLAGAAIHSVRAVPAADLAAVGVAASGRPLHVHLSEQPAENEACLAAHGVTPTALLDRHGVLGPAATVVHATHLTGEDITTLARHRVTACFCPTTERDLADGIGSARALLDAGAPLALGTDQHAVVDPFEEVRGLESHERLATLQRGRFAPAQLLTAASSAGHASLGVPDAGALRAGAVADLVAVRLDSPRTAGVEPGQVLYAATSADVDSVVVAGQAIVVGGRHVRFGAAEDIGDLLARSIAAVSGTPRASGRAWAGGGRA